MPSRKRKTGEQGFTYWRVTKDGQSKMWDSPTIDDDKAIQAALSLDAKYGGKFPTYRVERSDRTVIWERTGQ